MVREPHEDRARIVRESCENRARIVRGSCEGRGRVVRALYEDRARIVRESYEHRTRIQRRRPYVVCRDGSAHFLDHARRVTDRTAGRALRVESHAPFADLPRGAPGTPRAARGVRAVYIARNPKVCRGRTTVARAHASPATRPLLSPVVARSPLRRRSSSVGRAARAPSGSRAARRCAAASHLARSRDIAPRENARSRRPFKGPRGAQQRSSAHSPPLDNRLRGASHSLARPPLARRVAALRPRWTLRGAHRTQSSRSGITRVSSRSLPSAAQAPRWGEVKWGKVR